LCALLAAACTRGGSETGNPAREQIALALHTSDQNAVALASGSADARIEQAWVAFGRFQFFAAGTCAGLGEASVSAKPFFAADLAEPGAKVSLELEPGDYCGIVVPIGRQPRTLPDGAPAQLADHGIVVRGRLADGTRFSIAHPEQDELELAATHDTFAADPDLLLSFDVARWLHGLDIAGGTRQSDGSVRIDGEHNVPLLDAFEANVECSLELYRDADGDGQKSKGDPLLATCASD
jgi:hypothetical protein